MVFAPAGNLGGNQGQGKEVVRVVNPDSGFCYVPNKLSKKDAEGNTFQTEIRMLPYMDDEGQVYDPLHPQGSYETKSESLGIPFCRAEIVQFFKGGKYTLLTSIKDEDKEGNPVNGKSPWYVFMRRMNFKHGEITTQQKKGGAVEPAVKHWGNLYDSTFASPQNLLFIQVLAKKINGEVKKDNGKIVPVGPGVFAIPRGIETKTPLFQQMLTVDEDEDEGTELSPKTCKLGDFYTSEEGRPLRLTRNDEEEMTTYFMELSKKAWPLKTDNLKKMVRPWDEIFDTQYVEDSVKEIVNIMEPKMVAFAFRNSMYEPYLKDAGIDVDAAKDVIEPEVETVKGDRIRSADEVKKCLKEAGVTVPGESGKKSDTESSEKKDTESSGDTEKIEPEADNTERYQEELNELQDDDEVLNLE